MMHFVSFVTRYSVEKTNELNRDKINKMMHALYKDPTEYELNFLFV